MTIISSDTATHLRSVIYFPFNSLKTLFNSDSIIWGHKWLHWGVFSGWLLHSGGEYLTGRNYQDKPIQNQESVKLLEENKQLQETLNFETTKIQELESQLHQLNSSYIEASKKVEANLMKRVKEDQECVSKQQEIILTLICNKTLSKDMVKELLLPFIQKVEKELRDVTRIKQKLLKLLEKHEEGSGTDSKTLSKEEIQVSITQLTKVGGKFESLIVELTKLYTTEPITKPTEKVPEKSQTHTFKKPPSPTINKQHVQSPKKKQREVPKPKTPEKKHMGSTLKRIMSSNRSIMSSSRSII